MASSARERLLERALTLPLASPSDFSGDRRPPPDADPHHLRLIADTGLRARLLDANLAVGLQSPKGPQRIKSIVRIYPHFNAPPAPRHGSGGRKPAHRTSERHAQLATIEDMETLLSRVRMVETEVAREMRASVDADIDRLKRTMALLSGIELEESHRKLGEALARRKELGWQIRLEAYRRIEQDESFAPRIYLRHFAR
ncbi:MAG TPA: hypothetical protein VGZ00_02220 [Candidatus Baltobacteraceae bacterium]|jgi:hypothetical protein|nr:hypothetical protein [Candidatus Baltobacteraceae bacterium]